jgi:hypothetical protein
VTGCVCPGHSGLSAVIVAVATGPSPSKVCMVAYQGNLSYSCSRFSLVDDLAGEARRLRREGLSGGCASHPARHRLGASRADHRPDRQRPYERQCPLDVAARAVARSPVGGSTADGMASRYARTDQKGLKITGWHAPAVECAQVNRQNSACRSAIKPRAVNHGRCRG